MPIYDYRCVTCGPFEAMRRMAERDEPGSCPRCGMMADRVLVHAPGLADMPAAARFAMATNERARHEPKLSATHRHHSGCGCGKAGSGGSVAAKSFSDRRPWMISH